MGGAGAVNNLGVEAEGKNIHFFLNILGILMWIIIELQYMNFRI